MSLPFDEVKYNSLMSRLEAVEVKLSELEFSNRIDSEYYRKSFLKWENMILTCNHENLSKISNFLIGPFGSSYDTSNYVEKSDYRYVRGQDVKPFLLMDSESRYMNKSDFERLSKYALKESDILVSVVGTLGNACIVRKKDLPAIFSCKSTVIRTKKINAHYLITYLNSKYGRELLLRKERGALQKRLNLDDLRLLPIPIFSDVFEKNIEKWIIHANNVLDNSKFTYTTAQSLLLAELGLTDYTPSNESVSVKTFADSFGISGRLDAEYYQPKYDEIIKKIASCDCTTIDSQYIILKNSSNEYDGEGTIRVIKTKQLTNTFINTAVESKFTEDTVEKNKINLLENGDVLFASMGVGSLGKANIFYGKDKFATDSTLKIFRQKSDSKVKPEVLTVFLQSFIGQELIYKYVVGSTGIINIYNTDIFKIPIPIISKNIQQQIAEEVQQSFALRKKSAAMLEYAKQAVEMAIEQGEDAAVKWLEENVGEID